MFGMRKGGGGKGGKGGGATRKAHYHVRLDGTKVPAKNQSGRAGTAAAPPRKASISMLGMMNEAHRKRGGLNGSVTSGNRNIIQKLFKKVEILVNSRTPSI